MLSEIFTFYNQVLGNLKEYPMAQNALVTTFSIAVSGGIGFLLIKSPKTIVHFIKRQLMTSLEFNTQSSSWSPYNQEQFSAFLNWFSKKSLV